MRLDKLKCLRLSILLLKVELEISTVLRSMSDFTGLFVYSNHVRYFWLVIKLVLSHLESSTSSTLVTWTLIAVAHGMVPSLASIDHVVKLWSTSVAYLNLVF